MPPKSYRFNWLAICLLWLTLLWPPVQRPAYAAPSAIPAIHYLNNIIYIGRDNGAPATESITLPSLAQVLMSQGHPNLLIDQTGNLWLLKASILISTTGELVATSATIGELHLDSPSVDPNVQPVLNITARHRGALADRQH